MMTYWVYKLCNVVKILYLHDAFMAWLLLSLPIDLSLLMHIQIGGVDLGCLWPKSHDLLIFIHVEEMRCCYQVQSWWRIALDYFMLIGWTH